MSEPKLTKRQRERLKKIEDTERLNELLKILIEPFNDPDMDYLSVDDKLLLAFAHPRFEVYKRPILTPSFKIHGQWWMDEDEVNYGYRNAPLKIIRPEYGRPRILTTRTVSGSYIWVREGGDLIDIEAFSQVARRDPETGKSNGRQIKMLTVSVTQEEYSKLRPFLGRREKVCRHDYDL